MDKSIKLNIPIKEQNNGVNKFLFTPLLVSDLIKERLKQNRIKAIEERRKLELDFKLQLQTLNITEIVREDEILKSFMENSGFDYNSKYIKEEDFSFIHILNKKEKTDD